MKPLIIDRYTINNKAFLVILDATFKRPEVGEIIELAHVWWKDYNLHQTLLLK